MEARNQQFVERVCAECLSEQQLAQLALDPSERREVKHRLAQQAVASAQAALLAAEAARQAQQYEMEARLVQEVLAVAGLPLASLSTRAQLAARLVASLCSALGLAQPGLPEMLAAWAQLRVRESQAVVLQAKLRQHSVEVERNAARARDRFGRVQAALAEVQQQQASGERRARAEAQQVAELEAKQAEYAKSLEKCARKLSANGAMPDVRHSSLVERRATLRQLQGRVADLEAQLAGYHSLPPSMLGAGMMLQQARERLAAAQERLESGLVDL